MERKEKEENTQLKNSLQNGAAIIIRGSDGAH